MHNEPSPTATVSLQEAADYLGISYSTVYRLARQTGQLLPGVPALKFQTTYRVPWRQLKEAVDQRGAEPSGDEQDDILEAMWRLMEAWAKRTGRL